MARLEVVDDSVAVVLAQRWAAAGGHISLLIECDGLTRDGLVSSGRNRPHDRASEGLAAARGR